MSSELMKIFPLKLRDKWNGVDLLNEGCTEVRFRCNGPVTILKGREELFLHKHWVFFCCTSNNSLDYEYNICVEGINCFHLNFKTKPLKRS